jgi:hypothetical protein
MLPFFEYLQNTAFTNTVQSSWWMGALFNVLHLLALTVFMGALVMVDLRLLGVGLTDQPPSRVAGEARPWLFWGFIALLATGIPQFVSLAIRNYYNFFFWVKMSALVVAVLYTFVLRPKVVAANDHGLQMSARLVGLGSLALWFGIGVVSRMIGLS